MKLQVMKKNYFVIGFLAILNARAQYTLTASSNPVAGDIRQYCFTDSTGVTFGSAGAAQVWNYTDLVPFSTIVTETYTTAASTPGASLFPSANMAMQAGSSAMFSYYHMSATERSFVGKLNVGRGDVWLNSNPVPFSVLPFSYGSSPFSTNFTGSITTSVTSLNYSGVMTIQAEGTGTLFLPNGQEYSNALKIRTVETQTLTDFNIVNTTTVCEWYSAASKFPLLSILVYTSYDGSTTFMNKEVRMRHIPDVGLSESADTKAGFSIYPNPSHTHVFVDFETSPQKSYAIHIIDTQGRVIKEAMFRSVKNGRQHDCIDLSGLSTGTYFVKLCNEGKERVRQLVIE